MKSFIAITALLMASSVSMANTSYQNFPTISFSESNYQLGRNPQIDPDFSVNDSIQKCQKMLDRNQAILGKAGYVVISEEICKSTRSTGGIIEVTGKIVFVK